MTQTIPELTQEEVVLARQAEHSERLPLATVFQYLHWAKARADSLDALVKLGQQLPFDVVFDAALTRHEQIVEEKGEDHD